MIQIFTQGGRSQDAKQSLFAAVVARLGEVGVGGENVFIGYVENTPGDWSFGFGRAQYVTGELAVSGMRCALLYSCPQCPIDAVFNFRGNRWPTKAGAELQEISAGYCPAGRITSFQRAGKLGPKVLWHDS